MRQFIPVLLLLVHLADATNDWFLSEAEITSARGGHPRNITGIRTVSSNNEIIPLIDGKAFMGALQADIRRAQAGDCVHSTMFDVSGEVMLDPRAPDPASTKLSSVLIAAIQRNVTVRILVNSNVYIQSGLSFCHTINAACEHLPGKTCCAADSRHNALGGSVHAKSWSLVLRGEVVAYVGSMDVMGDRYDTPAHDDSAAREREPDDLNHFHGWYGNMFRVRGAAATDLARVFWYLWNDPAPLPLGMKWYTLAPYPWVEPPSSRPGRLSVQTVRTVGCKAAKLGYYQDFAPVGEYSFLSAFRKLAQNARKYIYLEDQFMYYKEALEIVAAALPHVEMVVIVTDNATAFSKQVWGVDVTVASDMRYYRQHLAMAPLIGNETLRHKVRVYELAREGHQLTSNFSASWLYTHAKNYIADDAFMLVGSHGIERTGFTNDIEVSMGVSDGNMGPKSFVGAFRRKLWAEHLQLNASDPMLSDPIQAISLFEKQAETGLARVRRYYPRAVGDSWAEDQVYNLYEPDGRCH